MQVQEKAEAPGYGYGSMHQEGGGRDAVQDQERMRPQVLVGHRARHYGKVLVGHRARHNGKLQRKRWVPVRPQQR